MKAHEKAAGVLDTPSAAIEPNCTAIVEARHIDRKELEMLRARFARRGYTFQRVYRTDAKHPTYHVTRTACTRVFSDPFDVGVFLAEVEESPV